MTLIPNFQEFEETNPLNGKITPALAESLAEYFADQGGINEAGVLDSIKNTLSKTFLGSLSYISMIDKVRTEVLKAEKELLAKRYAYEDEIDSLKTNLKEISKTKDASANIAQAEKTISNKTNEYQTYTKMVKARIEKALNTLSDAIKGNKRRMEYWEAGKAEDELVLSEFEYSLAKQRASASPEELKTLEEEIRKAKKEAAEAQEKIKTSQEESTESKKKAEEEGVKTLETPTPDFQKSLKSFKGTRALILYLKAEKDKLVDKSHDVKNDNVRAALKNSIRKVSDDLKLAEKVLDQHKNKKLMTSQKKYEQMILSSAKELSKNDTERKSTLKKSEYVVKGVTAKEVKSSDNVAKSEDVSKHQQKAETTGKVNQTISKK